MNKEDRNSAVFQSCVKQDTSFTGNQYPTPQMLTWRILQVIDEFRSEPHPNKHIYQSDTLTLGVCTCLHLLSGEITKGHQATKIQEGLSSRLEQWFPCRQEAYGKTKMTHRWKQQCFTEVVGDYQIKSQHILAELHSFVKSAWIVLLSLLTTS